RIFRHVVLRAELADRKARDDGQGTQGHGQGTQTRTARAAADTLAGLAGTFLRRLAPPRLEQRTGRRPSETRDRNEERPRFPGAFPLLGPQPARGFTRPAGASEARREALVDIVEVIQLANTREAARREHAALVETLRVIPAEGVAGATARTTGVTRATGIAGTTR